MLRGPLTEQGRAKLATATRRHRPWQYSTGPRTEAGKRKSSENSRWLRANPHTLRSVRQDLRVVQEILSFAESVRMQMSSSHD